MSLFLDPKRPPEGLTRERINYFMLGDCVVYLILYLYLDQVIKDENGVRKSYFFCCKRSKKNRVKAKAGNNNMQPLLEEEDEKENHQHAKQTPATGNPGADTSSAVYHEALHGAEKLQKTVEVIGLKKNFQDFKAVDNISFSIHKGHIFCLLGHNGAGKTTTIRMLTGLLEIDGGSIIYDGEDFLENLEEVRTKIGICTQQDILFEKLKVCEHLELIARLRQIPMAQVPQAVEDALHKVNLVNERDKYSEELSGGNKRKLSLAMAVLGNTKVIFLDEPTSGMDPQNRRVMWYHLKQLREQGLTILLTTHHLDEADELANRIAIMSKGKLLALGTSEFFKKNFGVGYHLNLTPVQQSMSVDEFNNIKPRLQELITRVIPSAKFDEQAAADVLKCALPFASQKDFPQLFAELEQNDSIRISVEMNTLEDVFVNIGLAEDRLLHGEEMGSTIDINVQPPECLRHQPSYKFLAQTFALAKRRVYLLTRSGRNLFLIILPLLLALIGVLGSFGFKRAEERVAYFQVVVLMAYSLNTAAYCSLPVYEREEKLKYLMDVMGLRNLPYWIGNAIIDFITICIVTGLIGGLYAWLYFDVDEGFRNLFCSPSDFYLIAIPHGIALVTMGYAFSFMFDKALSAVKYFPLLYFFVLFSLGSFFMFKLDGPEGLKIPVLVIISGIVCPSTLLMQIISGNLLSVTKPQSAVALLVYALVYFLIALLFESRRLSFKPKTAQQGWVAPEPQAIPVDVNDVNTERNKAHEANGDPIKALNLVKVYDNGYTAVRDVTFTVAPGQIFGLLGPNGAGKSTTFNILTAATPKSNGSVRLLNHEVDKNMPEVYEKVGICPQFNGLWEFLTVKEHLILFGNLKGLRGDDLEQVTNYYLDVLQLKQYANKQAGKLSGGNKRKLSVANAFIGSAYLLFLDEPSTGVDPLARRYLWNSIQQVLSMRQASVVLTTHSMYEAESLSHKIGILINGRFVCIGPTQYLKEKYSQGYKITVSLMPNDIDPTPQIQEAFPQAIRQNEASFIQQTYNLPFQGFKFSEAFEKLESLKEKEVIKDFSIYNTTLEQIFIHFSKFQINLGDT